MKKLLIVSAESIFAGNTNTGIADVTDGLATSMTGKYHVSVVTRNGTGPFMKQADKRLSPEGFYKARLFNVDYYLINPEHWEELLPRVIDLVSPDILHNLYTPELIDKVSCKPPRTVYTIDQADCVRGQERFLPLYDMVTTVSVNYAKEMLAQTDALADTLGGIKFVGITNGIDEALVNPKSGLLLQQPFSAGDMQGKAIAKKALQRKMGIVGNPPVFLVLSRLCDEKGSWDIINAIPEIESVGGELIVFGKGNRDIEKAFELAGKSNSHVHYICDKPGLAKSIPMLAGADFLLYPSKNEPCGLMPMAACKYGTIPIVTQVGGLADNFSDKNAVIIADGIEDAIVRADRLYDDREQLQMMRQEIMSTDFSWRSRAVEYVKLYEE